MMTTFLVITALSGITETVTGVKCPNVISGISCGVFKICPHPNSDDWKCLKRSLNCNENNGQYYHCAKDVNGCYVQHCARRVYCNSGEQPLLDLTEDTAMCQTCPAEEYQRRRFWSNEQRECDYVKTKCDGNGEIECHPGTPTEDRTCRCDIHQNLALQGYAYNKRTCCSKDYDPECYCISFKDQCPPGTVRHYNYMCLPECPQGLYRQMDAEDCIAMNSSTQTYVISTGQTPLQDSQDSTAIIILSIVAIVLVALIAASILICYLKRRQRRKQDPDEIEARIEDNNYLEVHRDPSESKKLLKKQKHLQDDIRKSKNAGKCQIINIHAPGGIINTGNSNNIQASLGKPESRDPKEHSFSADEEDVSMNPEVTESRQEDSIKSDETSMDTELKRPVENEDLDSDETPVKLPYPPQHEADDQTKTKEVWSPYDQTKRKEVSSPPEVVPGDQTKRKEVWSPPKVVPGDQTNRKEVWSPPEVVPDDQTKRKEVGSPPKVVPDDQTKRKEVWSESVVPNYQTKKMEPQIPGSNAEKRQKTEMIQPSGGSTSSRETDIKTKRSI